MTASKAFLPQQALLQVHPACLAVLERTFSWWCVPTASTRRKQRQHIAESRSASLPGGGGGGPLCWSTQPVVLVNRSTPKISPCRAEHAE